MLIWNNIKLFISLFLYKIIKSGGVGLNSEVAELLVFINNRGAILSRTKLLESIWDIAGEFVNDNTLTVYIKRLREKIEDEYDLQKELEAKFDELFGPSAKKQGTN